MPSSQIFRLVKYSINKLIVGERARHSQVCTIENRRYILWYVQFQFIARRAIRSVLYCSGKNPATLGYVSVLEFVLIESYLKAFSSDYGSNRVLNYRRKA